MGAGGDPPLLLPLEGLGDVHALLACVACRVEAGEIPAKLLRSLPEAAQVVGSPDCVRCCNLLCDRLDGGAAHEVGAKLKQCACRLVACCSGHAGIRHRWTCPTRPGGLMDLIHSTASCVYDLPDRDRSYLAEVAPVPH